MKKLKKFAALLLVGVMALALLTACGGGGSGEDAQAEASVMTAINGKRTAAAKLDNDAERKAVASQNIDYVVKHGFGPFSSDVRFNVDTDHIKDGKFGFTFVANMIIKILSWMSRSRRSLMATARTSRATTLTTGQMSVSWSRRSTARPILLCLWRST